MAQNNTEDIQMQLYTTQSDVILMEKDKYKKKKEMDELRRRLREQSPNDSLVDEREKETNKLKRPQQIIVIGGWNEDELSSDIILLDYNGKIWKKTSIELPQKVQGHGTVILEDELYIIGGFVNGYSSTLHRLNKKMKWEKLADMLEERDNITNSCISHNGCIWAIGGASAFFTSLNTVEKYDPVANRWVEKPTMKRRRSSAAAAVINDRIYVCGGIDKIFLLDTVEVFDISSEVWTNFCILPQPRADMSIIVDGISIVLIGGCIQKTVWKMDMERKNKDWIYLPPLDEDRWNSSAVRIDTGSILVFGGFGDPASSSVDIFSGQKWESFTPLPQPRRCHTSMVLTPAMIDAFRPYILEK